MSTLLNVLLLEDSETDAELILRELTQAGFAPRARRVETEADFRAALGPALDVVIADFRLPGWDALAEPAMLNAAGEEAPLIVVARTTDDDAATEALRRGAADFLFKDRLARLGPAVRRAVEIRRLRAELRCCGEARATERQQAARALQTSEERFLRMQRMEAIGALAGGIAHDLNNILAPMLMAAGLLKQKLTEQRDRDILAMVEHGAQRGATIIGQLLTVGRGSEGARVNVQLRHLLKEMVHVMHETFPRNIEVEQDTAHDLWSTMADPAQLHQLLLNLCVNARDAMPDGGGLILGASNLLVGEAELPLHPEAKAGRYVVVRVADTGQGIPAEIIDRIFEPFFTTKPAGLGTGLGLSTVRGIAKNHDGFVTVASEPDKGTVFEVYLPAATEVVASPGRVTDSQVPLGQGELILVVDDEAMITEAARHILENQGYRTLTARNGEEAAGLFIQYRGAMRLVLTDLMMPGMGGLALIRALRVLEPDLPVIAISGLAREKQLAELSALGITVLLAKPFDQDLLLRAVERVLSVKGRPGAVP